MMVSGVGRLFCSVRGERRLKFRLLCHVCTLRVQRVDLSLIGCLLRHLVLPLGLEH